ncbi:MAG: hypothetical protein GX102_09830 [Porphyromonadaceae bacterium]|nr:hypothetical protein [Porphyromonadaceae bacterium]
MKTLIILRHGKAELHQFGMSDYDRGLMSRGVKNSVAMGKFIAKKWGIPQLVLSSSAKRAYETAVLAAEGLGINRNEIQVDDNLYLVSERRILRILSELPDEIESCLLVGHNPGLTDLINYFEVWLDNLPTASAACFTFKEKSWKKITDAKAKLEWIKLAREL